MQQTNQDSFSATEYKNKKTNDLKLHGVRYQVQDVTESVAFYVDHLGFKVEHQHLPEFATVSLKDFKLFLSGPVHQDHGYFQMAKSKSQEGPIVSF